jgi:catechol 2,3-dioxygenase-like lactoylglutathione lyase family enzyme
VVSGTVVDGYAYSDRSETDRMTFDRASFHTSDLGPMNPGLIDPDPEEYKPRPVPVQPEPEPEPVEPARGDPFNVIPLRVRRPRKPRIIEPEPEPEPEPDAEPEPGSAAAPDPVDDERDTDAPPAEPTDGFGTEPASYLTAPSAGLSQLGAGGFSVTLFVRELSRSVTFYRDVLGLAEVDTGRNSAVLARGESRILLKRVGDLQPVDRRIVHLNLEVPDVQAAYDELKTKGVEFVHKPRVVSQGEQLELWAATFRDPDGHAIALTRWELRR